MSSKNTSQVPNNQESNLKNLSMLTRNPGENTKAVFPVIKNPVANIKPIPYTQDPYQEPYDKMLAKDKQALYDQHKETDIQKLVQAMGGPDNYCNHFNITPAEFYSLYPDMRDKKNVSRQPQLAKNQINSGPIYYQPQPVTYNPGYSQVLESQRVPQYPQQPQYQRQIISRPPENQNLQPQRSQEFLQVNALPPPRKSEQPYVSPSYPVGPNIISNTPQRQPTPTQPISQPQTPIMNYKPALNITQTVSVPSPIKSQPIEYRPAPVPTQQHSNPVRYIQTTNMVNYQPQIHTFQSSPPRNFPQSPSFDSHSQGQSGQQRVPLMSTTTTTNYISPNRQPANYSNTNPNIQQPPTNMSYYSPTRPLSNLNYTNK